MRVAVYRILYGEDFVQESIRSILPHVDRVVVCLAPRPWGTSEGVFYEPCWVPWPYKFDRVREKIEEMHEPSVIVADDSWPAPKNQHQHIVNDIVLPKYRADEVLFIEPDHVFSELAADRAFEEWDARKDAQQATTRMIELWRTPVWRIAERHRPSVMFHRINGQPMRETSGDGGQSGISSVWLKAEVHNLGFCFSDKVMRWKHLTAMAFAEEIGDAPPDPYWFERWANWAPGDKNLEISMGGQHTIPEAVRMTQTDIDALPESIRARLETETRFMGRLC